MTPGEAQPRQGAEDGLALRVEDLGLGHDVDDDSGHGGLLVRGWLAGAASLGTRRPAMSRRTGDAPGPDPSPAPAHWRHEHPPATPGRSPLKLEFPQSLAVYDDYAAAQRSVDFLSDNKFPVEHCMIVGTDLKRVERITGRLTTGRVALGGRCRGCGSGCSSG